MDITKLQKAYDEYHAREGELIARQDGATTDRLRFECERMRRLLLVKLEAVIQGDSTRDFIRQVECQLDGEQRAA